VLRSSSDSGRVELSKGAFGSMLVAYEGKNVGIGGGVTAWPGSLIEYGEYSTPREFEKPTQVLPSAYLRFGRADKVHLRFDDNASSAPGTLPGYRLGVASGYLERWQPRWFAGLMGQEKTSGIGGELGFPLGQRLEPVIHGSASLSKDSPGWSLGRTVPAGLQGGSAGRPWLLFDGTYPNLPGYSHALMPDGHRHLLVLGPAEQTARRIEVVVGWAIELRRLVPAR
jgi:hypothetical protein